MYVVTQSYKSNGSKYNGTSVMKPVSKEYLLVSNCLHMVKKQKNTKRNTVEPLITQTSFYQTLYLGA